MLGSLLSTFARGLFVLWLPLFQPLLHTGSITWADAVLIYVCYNPLDLLYIDVTAFYTRFGTRITKINPDLKELLLLDGNQSVVFSIVVLCVLQRNVPDVLTFQLHCYRQKGQETHGRGERFPPQALCHGQEEDQWHLRAAGCLYQGELSFLGR